MNFKKKTIWIVIIAMSMVVAASGEVTEWNQWRSPKRDAIARDKGLLQQWPEGGPRLVWKATGLGGGFSGISFWGGRIFTMGDKQDGSYLVCVSKVDGTPLWSTRVGRASGNDSRRPGPRCTPATDGTRIITVGQ